LIEEKLDELRPGKATGVLSNFLTSDLLAGDMNCVFLAPLTWYGLCSDYGNGIVFDAEELIRSGAGLRGDDIAKHYRLAILDTLASEWQSQDEAEKFLLRSLYEVKAKYELHGESAIRLLTKLDREWRRRVSREKRTGGVVLLEAELTWCGRLSIRDAVEVWKNGKKIR
jgi:hypothetical protein